MVDRSGMVGWISRTWGGERRNKRTIATLRAPNKPKKKKLARTHTHPKSTHDGTYAHANTGTRTTQDAIRNIGSKSRGHTHRTDQDWGKCTHNRTPLRMMVGMYSLFLYARARVCVYVCVGMLWWAAEDHSWRMLGVEDGPRYYLLPLERGNNGAPEPDEVKHTHTHFETHKHTHRGVAHLGGNDQNGERARTHTHPSVVSFSAENDR